MVETLFRKKLRMGRDCITRESSVRKICKIGASLKPHAYFLKDALITYH